MKNIWMVVIDVRPQDEYDTAHLPYARSIPLTELTHRLAELPRDAQIVAYCRGPFCLMSDEAVKLLLEQFIPKLGSKHRRIKGPAAEDFEAMAGLSPAALLAALRTKAPAEAVAWIAAHAPAVDLLDRSTGGNAGLIISEHPTSCAAPSAATAAARSPPTTWRASPASCATT